MSEDAAELDDRPLSPATDPSGIAAAGERPDNWHPTGSPAPRRVAEWTDEEKLHNRRTFGVTYQELYGRDHAQCVAYCVAPGQKTRGVRCPACYGPVAIRPISQADIDPAPTRAERFTAWVGGWCASFIEALLFPFRVGRAHTEAQVRDILQRAIEAGLRAEVMFTCPQCGAQGHPTAAGE